MRLILEKSGNLTGYFNIHKIINSLEDPNTITLFIKYIWIYVNCINLKIAV
jgi:hypothetical protein